MLYEHGGWTIDATPDYSAGKFFARARLTRVSTDDGEQPEMHIEHAIAWFDSEALAIQCARRWAIGWIDEREGTGAITQPGPVSAMPATHARSGQTG